jgi:hypothetical protein
MGLCVTITPIKYIDPTGEIYVIAWSYGKYDIDAYKDSDGNVNWDKFTKENSFARAAYTRRQELIDSGVPESEIDMQRIDNIQDLKDTWNMWAGYENVEGLEIYSHGSSDGIIVAWSGEENYLSNAQKLKWGSVLRNGKDGGFMTDPYAAFFGCGIALGDLPQNFANTQNVRTFAQIGSASFSRDPNVHIKIKDKATTGKVYLRHFDVKNLYNTYGWGKKFTPAN